MTKKVFIVLIAVVLCFVLSTAVFAATVSTEGASQSHNVTGNYVRTGEPANVYCVDIVWGDMEYTYSAPAKTWDPESHSYKETETGSWSCGSGSDTVTVINHSNIEIKAEVTYNPDSVNGVIGVIDEPTLILVAPAEGSAYDTAPGKSAKLSLSSDNLPTGFTDGASDVKVGTVTVTVCANTPSQSYEWLVGAVAQGGSVAMENDISSEESISVSGNTLLDLGGRTLTVNSMQVASGANLTVTNGTLSTADGIINKGSLTVNGANIVAKNGAAIDMAKNSSLTISGNGIISSAAGSPQVNISATDVGSLKINLENATGDAYTIKSAASVDDTYYLIKVGSGYKIYGSSGTEVESIGTNETVTVKK